MNCNHLQCSVGPLYVGRSFVVRVQSFLWVSSLVDEAFYHAQISSFAVARVTKLPYQIPDDQMPVQSAVVSTYVTPKDPARVAIAIPWWIWLIAAAAGLTLLALLVLCCWRVKVYFQIATKNLHFFACSSARIKWVATFNTV